MLPPAFPVTVFFDGSCRVCAREMAAYRRRSRDGRLVFVDISDPAFRAEDYGCRRDDLMVQLHAIDRRGAVYRGVEAFRVIWLALPNVCWFRVLAALVAWPVVGPAARLAYRLFARYRKYLPKRKGRE